MKDKKMEFQSKIETQKLIDEIDKGSYHSIRISRVKYKNNLTKYIDIRQYQRGYNDEGEGEYFPTKVGFHIQEIKFRELIKNYEIVPQDYIHPLIIERCFNLMKSSEYESAVFQSFKLIEINIRKRVGAESDELGVKLIRKAFNPKNGVLTDFEATMSEREALSNYISGAFGFYKNPCSHRQVKINFQSAFDKLLVASDILKIIDNAKINE